MEVDEGIAEEQWKEEYQADLAFRRQQAEWRKIRGESLPEDEELLRPGAGGGGDGQVLRDTWMTELPPERRPTVGPVMPQTQTAFSKRAITGRGDTSGWTDTPEAAAEKAQQLLLGNGGGESLTFAIQDREERERRATRIAAVDDYNARNRPKTLLEMHQARTRSRLFTVRDVCLPFQRRGRSAPVAASEAQRAEAEARSPHSIPSAAGEAGGGAEEGKGEEEKEQGGTGGPAA